jgi:hypothetical protein
VVSCGWGGTAKRENSSSVFFIDACPHDWLFPQMKAVIHHGGAGTVYDDNLSFKSLLLCSASLAQGGRAALGSSNRNCGFFRRPNVLYDMRGRIRVEFTGKFSM